MEIIHQSGRCSRWNEFNAVFFSTTLSPSLRHLLLKRRSECHSECGTLFYSDHL
uniref:Uncharacterized protein n=1 Tax=Parascaris univalens TaxID=6257 RepID=A0A915A244_PARUN